MPLKNNGKILKKIRNYFILIKYQTFLDCSAFSCLYSRFSELEK